MDFLVGIKKDTKEKHVARLVKIPDRACRVNFIKGHNEVRGLLL